MSQPAQRDALRASADVPEGCIAAASSGVAAEVSAAVVPTASTVSSPSSSFPRAGGSRDGHCPCYAKNSSFEVLNSSVNDGMISSNDSVPSL